MRNKYPGPCYRCLCEVKKGEGHFERYMGRWRLQHASCCIEHRNKKLSESDKPQPQKENSK